jgi:hypothetical protein
MDRIAKQYRAHVALDGTSPTICEFVGNNLQALKDRVTFIIAHVLNGNVRMEPVQTSPGGEGLVLIYHPKFEKGEKPLGWISGYEVPEAASVTAEIELLRSQEVAA